MADHCRLTCFSFQRKEHSPFNRLTVNRNACVTGEKSSNAKPVEKLRMVGHHYGCGAERESIQGLVERKERGSTTAHTDRRKPGVTRRSAESEIKNSSKILLTENGGRTILPLRQ
jgi:hypothetical protein